MVIVAERILQDSDVSHVAPLEKLELLQKLEQARQWIEKAADAGNLKAKVLLPTVNAIIQGVQSHQ
jgi:TPR repeat protein